MQEQSRILNIKYCTNLANGGKTATANKPRGTRANDKDKVWIAVLVGKPPPPAVPTDGDPAGVAAGPLLWKPRSGNDIAIPNIPIPNVLTAWAPKVPAGESKKSWKLLLNEKNLTNHFL